jgi:hypothetical protein
VGALACEENPPEASRLRLVRDVLEDLRRRQTRPQRNSRVFREMRSGVELPMRVEETFHNQPSPGPGRNWYCDESVGSVEHDDEARLDSGSQGIPKRQGWRQNEMGLHVFCGWREQACLQRCFCDALTEGWLLRVPCCCDRQRAAEKLRCPY